MSDKRQSEQQPVHVGGCVSNPVSKQSKPQPVEQDDYNAMNGVCCK